MSFPLSLMQLHEIAQGRADRVDLVRDCADLADKFPRNVRINVVLAGHGDRASPLFHLSSRSDEALLGSNVIGKEVAVAWNFERPRKFIETRFAAANSLIERHCEGEWGDSELADWQRLGDEERQLFDWGRTAWGRSSSVIPRVVPIDTYAERRAAFRSRFYDADGTKGKRTANIRIDRHREGAVIRQLHAIAERLSKKYEHAQIAAVVGANHYLMPAAASALGADVVITDDSVTPPSWEHLEILEIRTDPGAWRPLMKTSARNAGGSLLD